MPVMSPTQNPDLAKKIIDQVTSASSDRLPSLDPPEPSSFRLACGYLLDNGAWTNEFEVRELTGRDEEYLAKISDPGKVFMAMLERGLVSVGGFPANRDVVDGLVAGDWETVLVAICAVTFGRTLTINKTCSLCAHEFVHHVDVLEDIEHQSLEREDMVFDIKGRHGNMYRVTVPYGSTQRKMVGMVSASFAESNTLLLMDCVLDMDGRPPLTMNDIRDLPWSDRKSIVNAIDERKVGPDFSKGVKTKCPACDSEQIIYLGIADLFR